MVDLVVTGSFEVTAEALQIIEEMSLTESYIMRLNNLLNEVDTSKLVTEHNRDGYHSLMKFLT